MSEINKLPYIITKNNKRSKQVARFLLKKIKRKLEKLNPYHYLIFYRKDKLLKVIKNFSKKYPYFLRFDIEKYYPSIDHQILKEILENYINSRRGKILIRNQIVPFLKHYQIFQKGLPLGNFLSSVLAGYYLLPLDIELYKNKIFFLRVQDDYLVFLKRKKQPMTILREIIEPTLNKLKLEINPKKIKSGRFHEDSVEFVGFVYYGGIFKIAEEKIEEFKNRIIKITHLNKKKPIKAALKLVNNKVLGFGHYYKYASCKETFKDLDSFIRQRVRRYIFRIKNQKDKTPNLLLTNDYLFNLGLKSLVKIKEKFDRRFNKKEKYDQKRLLILEKINKNILENESPKNTILNFKTPKLIDKIYLKTILDKLEEITKKLDKIEKLIKENTKIE